MNNIFNLIQMFQQNPMQMLSRRFNIPQGVNCNDPNAIIEHLVQTGQVSQQQITQAQQMRRMFGGR
jgi:hypothetical protein